MDKSSEYRLEQYASRYSQGIKSMSSFNHTTNNYFHILYIYHLEPSVYYLYRPDLFAVSEFSLPRFVKSLTS
ncbi:unnamed protein product [Heterobilharzia americana]|nr:unnamed protein product [Heterobilharzia americana]